MTLDLASFLPSSGPARLLQVAETAELHRIRHLPVRDESQVELLVDLLTKAFRKPEGEMRLWQHQALVLSDLHDYGGLIGGIGVGGGKTLITFLAPQVVGAVRPVLLVPAQLKKKTYRDFVRLSKHWTVPQGPDGSTSIYNIRVVSYEKLSRSGNERLLNGCDLLMADEAHKLKNVRSACTRKVLDFCRQHPNVPVMFLSGTLVSRGLMDFWHLLMQTHDSENAPLPTTRNEAEMWAAAVDEKVEVRYGPGALSVFLEPGEEATIHNVRKGLGRRIFSTVGCVRTTSPSSDVSIMLEFDDPPVPDEVAPILAALFDDGVAPNGDELLPTDYYRFGRQLALGFYYEWDPPAPIWWMEARRRWRSFARTVLEDPSRTGCYSEMDVTNLVDEGQLPEGAELLAVWRDVRDQFVPNPVPRWVSTKPLQEIVKAVRKIGPCLVWIEHGAVGDKLSEMTGWRYYRESGRDSEGRFIDDDPATEPILVSIASNAEGRNLQHWSKNYVATPPTSGRLWEQLIGRTHRAGQEADTVEVYVRLGHYSIVQQFVQAVRDAALQQSVSGQSHRLLLADYANLDLIPADLREMIENTRSGNV